MNIPLYIESLIFTSQKPIKIVEIQNVLLKITDVKYEKSQIEAHIHQSIRKYQSDDYPFQICVLAEGYQFLTKKEYDHVIKQFVFYLSKKKLSKSALETLAIIAYKQPITRREIDQIRGVSSDYAVQKLLERELIVIQGKSEAVGRPLIYGTSDKFLVYFGIQSLAELPLPKDFSKELNSIGSQND